MAFANAASAILASSSATIHTTSSWVSLGSVGLSAQARKEVKSRTSRTLMVECLDWIIAWAAVMSIRFHWQVRRELFLATGMLIFAYYVSQSILELK